MTRYSASRRLAAIGIVGVVVAGLAPAGALAQDTEPDEGSATEGALFLLLPVGPKAVALGRAVTSLPGAESIWWNPAGLSEVDEGRVLLFRGDDLAGEATAVSVLLTRPGLGAVSFGYQLMDAGTQDLRDPQGNFIGTIDFRNHLGVFSAAAGFWDRAAVGFNLKLVQSRLTCRGQCDNAGVTATTVAVDAGVQARELGGLPLRLGLTLAHAGPNLQFLNEEQADPLPTRVRLGGAYQVLRDVVESDELALWISVDLEDRWRAPGDPATYVGTEFSVGSGRQQLMLRAGYVLERLVSRTDGAAVGLGLRYEDFDLGIAKSLSASSLTSESEPVHVSFGFVF